MKTRSSTRPRTVHGGLHFTKAPCPLIETIPLPRKLKVPLKQHQGEAATTIVTPGQRVDRGQALTSSENLSQTPVHASAGGIVETIHPEFITIKVNQTNETTSRSSSGSELQLSKNDLVKILHKHGIAGMGGAGFPTAKKIDSLARDAKLLLVNAAECDPVIHCDDALMQNQAHEIVSGIGIIARACNINTIVIGIEDNKPKAQQAIRDALIQQAMVVKIITVPAIYPSGAETILAQLCAQENISDSALASDQPLADNGVLPLNVATCFSIYQAAVHDTPLVSRITSVVDAQGTIRNFQLPIGTPITHLFEQLGLNNIPLSLEQHKITSGGQMMGVACDLDTVITKSTNCIIFEPLNQNTTPIRACIRCGACAEVCPKHLLPQQLHLHTINTNHSFLQQYKLTDCIECRCCDAVCPSHIPLTSEFQQAKQAFIELEAANTLAELAKMRYEKRQLRLANKNDLRTRRASNRKTQLPATPLNTAANDNEQQKKQLIAAALQRKRRKVQSTLKDQDKH